MTRRLRIAGTAFGAILVPACAALPPDPPTIKTGEPTDSAGGRPQPVTRRGRDPEPPSRRRLISSRRTHEEPTFAHVPTPTIAHCRPRRSHPCQPRRPSLSANRGRTDRARDRPTPAPADLFAADRAGRSRRRADIPPAEPVPDAEGIIRPWPTIKDRLAHRSRRPRPNPSRRCSRRSAISHRRSSTPSDGPRIGRR